MKLVFADQLGKTVWDFLNLKIEEGRAHVFSNTFTMILSGMIVMTYTC